jgi:hypothetical protein
LPGLQRRKKILIELFIEALLDTLKMLPFLLITFIFIEYFEHKLGKKFDDKIMSAGKFGPIIGALLGIIPQCGFSVMAVAFYSESLISLGTMVSVFIATSDEALPILISTPGAIGKVIPLIITKLIFAIIWGYIIDIIFKSRVLREKKSPATDKTATDKKEGCEDECITASFKIKDIFMHSLKRTLKISLYILVITFGLNILVDYLGIERITKFMYKDSPMQTGVASLLGLIPNCAISIGLVEIYLKGAISFASLVAGLSSNAGLAILVLFKEEKRKLNAVLIMALLFFTSFITGLILHFV